MKIPQFGENVYKQVTVDGKKVSKWLQLSCIQKIDENGNCIHWKDSDYDEKWLEYDSNNNLIHIKRDNGYEEWLDNDNNGKCVHWKDSNDDESYFEYDENGHMIHKIDSNGDESWFEIECHENGKEKLVLSYCRI